MATVVMTITDRGNDEVNVVVQGNPPIPLTSEGDPVVDDLTPAQCAAVYAARQIVEASSEDSEWRTLLT